MADAIVVGAGPNGLAAGVALARAGVTVTVLEGRDTIGGGTRSSESTLPGLIHDHCAAVHPMAAGSPFLRSIETELGRHGLRWRWPPVGLAHPFDDGSAAVLHRSLAATADALGPDGPRWRRTFGALSEHFDDLAADVMQPLLHLPSHPALLARFGTLAALPATALARTWRGRHARALFAGAAAHAVRPLSSVGSSAVGVMLTAAGHSHGWPVAEGGSANVTAALAAYLEELGGKIETGVWVRSLDELPRSDLILLALAPRHAVAVCGARMPPRVRRAYSRWRHGPGAFKVDLAVDGGIPWLNPLCREGGTVHVGGTSEEIAAAEREVARGRMPSRPFVLVAQQYLADPGRAAGSTVPVWAYAHVPHGWAGDATDAVLDQLERFAPGTRERIVARRVTSVAELTAGNPNIVGGDILTGANTLWQSVARPRPTLDPYATGIPGVFLCSAATPPGAGVHGMCGAGAARSALRQLSGRPSAR